jgi:ABC-type transporter Mla subunit MlaD
MEEALISIGQRFNELSTSMRAIEGALTSQKVALEATSGEARKTAQALGESASSVRTATAPLMAVGTNFANASEKLASSVDSTLAALGTAKDEVAALAATLAQTNARSGEFWTSFSSKFDTVDTALGKAVEVLSISTAEQQDRLRSHVQSVDIGLTEAIGKLNGLVTGLNDSAEMIADSLEQARSSRSAVPERSFRDPQ